MLIKDVQRSPFEGPGKPEPLKHALSGYWSRRITDEHRIVYKVEGESTLPSSPSCGTTTDEARPGCASRRATGRSAPGKPRGEGGSPSAEIQAAARPFR